MPKGVPRAGGERGPPGLHSAQLSWASLVLSFALKSAATVSSFISYKVQAFFSRSPRMCFLCVGERWCGTEHRQEGDPNWNVEKTPRQGVDRSGPGSFSPQDSQSFLGILPWMSLTLAMLPKSHSSMQTFFPLISPTNCMHPST